MGARGIRRRRTHLNCICQPDRCEMCASVRVVGGVTCVRISSHMNDPNPVCHINDMFFVNGCGLVGAFRIRVIRVFRKRFTQRLVGFDAVELTPDIFALLIDV